jgi:N-acyl-D-amino-acid deacylase
VVIRGGVLFSGENEPPVRGDIGISGETVQEVGDLTGSSASVEISAHGRHVAPGFIDIHTHSDISSLYHPLQESIVSQGITTQVVGNCSLSMGFAIDAPAFAFERRRLEDYGLRIDWGSMEEHLSRVEDAGISTNYVMLAGQGTLRKRAMGLEHRPPTPAEFLEMERLLHDAMDAGCWGLSSGLEYIPSRYADIPELSRLCSVLVPYGGFYASHLRSEGDQLEESVAEALEIGRRAGVPVQLSHHKAEGPRNWGKVHRTLRMVDACREEGLDAQLDQYPYTAFQTGLSVQFLPGWAVLGEHRDVMLRLQDTTVRSRIIQEMLALYPEWEDDSDEGPWGRVEIGACRADRSLQGRRISEIARTRGVSPMAAVLDVIVETGNMVSGINFAICEEDIAVVMQHPWTMIGSDAVGTAPRPPFTEEKPHPRSYGTFPRVLGRYVRELGVLPEHTAVHKMTGMPADRLGLQNRGRIKPGYKADITIYNPKTVGDAATFDQPHCFAVGIDVVLVNGSTVWKSGQHTGLRPGKVLRKNR